MKKILLFLTILSSFVTNAQDFWTKTAPFQSGVHYVTDISIVNESTVWVTGTDLDGPGTWSVWRWARSNDGGLTWTDGFLPDDVTWPNFSSQYITNITAISDQTAYIGNASANNINKLLVTHDAGNTWTQIHPELFSDVHSFMRGVHFFDNNHGIAFGDPVNNHFEIYTTTDASATWTRTPSTNIPAPLPDEHVLTNHFDTTAGIIRFVTNKNRLFTSQDRGLTWISNLTPANSFYEERYSGFFSNQTFSFKNANEGLLITTGDNPSLYGTTEGGITWFPIPVTGTLFDRSVIYVPQTPGTYYNTGSLSYEGNWSSGYSTSYGNSWTQITENPNFKPVITEFFSPTIGFASGYDTSPSGHGFYRLTDTFNRLLKNKSFLETNFSVSPNPTKDIFKINGSAIESVIIHDATGKVIHKQSFARTDLAEINLSGLSTGIYLANISNDSGSKTIKIIKN